MNTKAWGKFAWPFLNFSVANYSPSPENTFYMRQFFNSLGYVLPCKHCKKSYREFIKRRPVEDYLHSREALQYWLYMIHNDVNDKLRRQGDPIPPNPSFKEVCAYYERFRAKCNPNRQSCDVPLTREDRKNMKRT